MYQKIFCPIDGSDTSNRGADTAIRLAKDQSAQLCFLHIVDNGPLIMYSPVIEEVFENMRRHGRNILGEAISRAREQGVAASSKILEIMTGRAGPLIVEEADKYGADIIVMGTHGRRGINRLLMGSDASTVICTSKVATLLVK